ncbi:MAG: hypothetical protein KME45_03410 [Stenomitos rutilans HA7619-LM2]|jgi:hypothetical protein|nr:hypothetical protein [Stenomitos rutilans HA7619-LM2]MBW4469433.1 hypothetical protein [Stenomitos rutilans HA7619-LM2]
MVKNGIVATAVGPEVTNGALEVLELCQPYIATVKLEGVADILFHRWNCEEVEAKANAAKGSKTKKSDNIESYVYRDDEGILCIPGEYFRMAVINAAKFRQDPRSPRKSAMDLYKAGIVALTPLAPLGVSAWDYEHKCRVTVQRAGITRTRPALKAGWKCEISFLVNVPEYIRPVDFMDVLTMAGKLIGVADFRPTYGRFVVTSFQVGLD